MPAEHMSPHRIAMTVLIATGVLAPGAYWRAHIERVRAAEALSASVAAAGVVQPGAMPPWTHRTAHFSIESTAGEADTAEVGRAAEVLHAAWRAFFTQELAERQSDAATREAPLRMRLYGSQAEFKAHNRSRQWAEAFYLRPVSDAYVSRGRGNRHHWMLHEAVHQLNAEVLGRRHPRWVEEGLASYFGTSRMQDGRLHLGDIDAGTYPAWWLPDFALGDSADEDARRRRMIPLQAMLTGRDVPALDTNVNLHYIQHWSLVHYLLHGDGGRHAAGFRALMGTDAGLEAFERLIGPVGAIESGGRMHRGAMLAQMQAHASRTDRPRTAGNAPQIREYDQDTMRPSR